MFDKYTVHGGGTSHNTTTITEKRAPTDDSVKLLREMEEAAEKKMLGAIRLDTNTMSGIVVERMRQALTADSDLLVLFDLNGKRHKHVIQMRESSFLLDKRSAFEQLAKSLAEEIVNQLVEQVVREIT
jgi:hypothetical protein